MVILENRAGDSTWIRSSFLLKEKEANHNLKMLLQSIGARLQAKIYLNTKTRKLLLDNEHVSCLLYDNLNKEAQVRQFS